MDLERFFLDNDDWRPYADLVAIPPLAEEMMREYTDISNEPLARCMEFVREGGGFVTRGAIYLRCRREDRKCNDRWATMLCLNAPPGINTTDTFWAGRKSWVEVYGEDYANRTKKALAAKGVTLNPGDEYMPELARFPNDPEAKVPFGGARSYIKDLCNKRGWACILPHQIIQGSIIGASKAWYSGKAVEVVMVSGAVLSVTANHPIVTMKGLIPAGQLNKGDNLLRYVREDNTTLLCHDEQYAPATAEKVFSTLVNISGSILSNSKLACNTLDFHGDAKFFEGDIETIGTYCELARNKIAQASEGFSYSNLVGSRSEEFELASCGPLEPRLHRTFAGVGVREELVQLPIQLSSGEFAPHQPSRFGPAAQLNTVLSKLPRQGPSIGAGFGSQLLQDSAGAVLLDQVSEVRNFVFSGHVYDFESPFGWIVANALLVSNCEGAVSVKHRQPDEDPHEMGVQMAEDLIRQKASNMVRSNPDLRRKTKAELRQMVLEKHGPSKIKANKTVLD